MDQKYEDKSKSNVDKNEKAWEFTFLGDSNYIELKEENNHHTLKETYQQVVETNFPLTQAKRGDHLHIITINAIDEMARSLKKMGLVVGVELEVISNNPSGSVIVAVGDRNIGLGLNPASNIIVSAKIIDQQ
ncbi:MAG: ferrous iron transport protein A [Okeania sp. SIO2G4]|uniref:FeoA family protein n=1 Tax=unclassified Okeania TaxID=2634635 RepID=UPI0013B6C612|nr:MULTISPECIES: FeoA family protein [unclassified Okeania]NEP42960.1 ferrous iron transport protein A [Okeania sp. SIO2H7]NEP76089.1 ferrous iron transport protein A [Okeania sp. SIO2G5]NEP97268.1 ferrous iron transport protein A [Okeania sp. SIO2F5]NEQ94987.1 ferrous iron transport protein A [Okeania sp. SIO2G4]